jgi:hypothetical protein
MQGGKGPGQAVASALNSDELPPALAMDSDMSEHVDPWPCQDLLGAECAAPDSGRSPVGGV